MRDLIIILILVLVFISVFSSKGKNIMYQHLEPKTIYDIETSSYTIEQQNFFSVEYSKSLPTYNIYSEIYLPEKFIANIVKTKSQAQYIIITSDMLEKKFVFIQPQQKESNITLTAQIQQSKVEKKLPPKKEVDKKTDTTTQQETTQEITQQTKKTELTYRDIKEYVQKSLKTYFYPGLSTGKEVVVSVVSYTPYQDNQGIVKFKIENKQKSFFFINTVEIQTETAEKIPIKVFSEQFIQPNSEIEGYVLFPIHAKSYHLCIFDGKNTYKLRFKIP